MSKSGYGIVLCGGGYKYFSNVWINLRLLRSMECSLPVEIWMWENEYDPRYEAWVSEYSAVVKCIPVPSAPAVNLPGGQRWQWVLKPLALLQSQFRHVLYLDADSFSVCDSRFLFETVQYCETGALFWPDVGRMSEVHPIWEEMGVPYRDEPEFESGQMVIDTLRHREPLELALKMNREAEKYYGIIWGDKDTFRFAFHKYGRHFSMTPYPLQMLSPAGTPPGTYGVMCQHDFEGNRIFQHRNNVKWGLLEFNARVPGYLYEEESRGFLNELRVMWNGRLNWSEPKKSNYSAELWSKRTALVKDLISGKWLLDDRRPTITRCCGPVEKWSERSVSKPWQLRTATQVEPEIPLSQALMAGALHTMDSSIGTTGSPGLSGATTDSKTDRAANLNRGLRRREVAFASDSTLCDGASPQAYWWDLELENAVWVLYLVNEKGRVAKMGRTAEGSWMGRWSRQPGAVVGLKRVEVVYGFLNKSEKQFKPTKSGIPKARTLHLANHANGIGDAITGLYAAMTQINGRGKVVYHTRFARWLTRASHPLLTITQAVPPKGTCDMDADYAEQLRYAPDKVAWYAGQAWWTGSLPSQSRLAKVQTKAPVTSRVRNCAGEFKEVSGNRLEIDRTLRIPRLDFPKYVLLAPFAAWESRDWPETHWRRLAWLLNEAGYEIVAIGTKDEAERMERTFNKSFAYWAIDHDPEWVMDTMLDAAAVIGLDSGMIHVAGLLGVPAVCIHAHLPPEFLFSHAPTVKSITPTTGCVFCRWQEDRGFMEGCGTACSAMAVVGPEAVMATLAEIKERDAV